MAALGFFTQSHDGNHSGAPNKLAQMVTLISYICEMNISNFGGQGTGYRE
jgi:hypothetical protein